MHFDILRTLFIILNQFPNETGPCNLLRNETTLDMSITTTILLALALAMDAFAVSISIGIGMVKMQIGHALRMAFCFGLFQALMPLAGWSIGIFAAEYIKTFDHWIAFVLLLAIGGKMLYEAFTEEECEEKIKKTDPFCYTILLVLAVATSIDAAAVGVTISFLDYSILKPALIIGIITFIISLGGVFFGKRIGDIFGRKVEIAGGLVLIGIGIKILIEHLWA